MAKFPSHIIERAVDAGFSDEEIAKAQKNMALEAFEEQIAEREGGTLPDDIDSDNIVEMDMTQEKTKVPDAVRLGLQILGEVDPATLQRFKALCLLKGWGFGEKLTEILEDLLTEEGFKREDKPE